MRKHVVTAVVLASVAGSLLGSCSSGKSVSSASSTSSTRAPISSSGSTSSTRSGGTSTPTTSGGYGLCIPGQLIASLYGSSGAAGTIEITVALKSTATGYCTLGGYPGLQMIGSNGSALPTSVVRKGAYSFTSMTPTTPTLASGQTAYFNMGYSDVASGSQSNCPMSVTLEITPPNATGHVSIPAQLAPCDNGTITVSPVFLATGTDAQTMAPPH
jgi:Protein of unknown function (DUF4232)